MSSLRDFPFLSPAIRPVLAAAIVAALSWGCGGEVTSQESSPTSGGEEGQALARIDGETITVEDLEAAVGDQLASLEFQYRSQRHDLLETGLEEILRQRLLAAAAADRGVTVDELVAEEVGETEVSEEQVESFYENNRSRLQGQSLEALRPAIRQFLVEQQREEAIGRLTERIAADHDVDRLLEPFRVDLETESHPFTGPADAPVTLVEFSDFECPYCGGFFQTVERVKEEYGDRVRIVYRQFPLRQLHPNAQKAAEASLCAADQGKFWELHDLMFTEQHSLGVEALIDKAERIGLNVEAFSECVRSGEHAEQVQEDVDAGVRVGVSGTPAVFVNGIPVEGGAVPYEELAAVIDEELERVDG